MFSWLARPRRCPCDIDCTHPGWFLEIEAPLRAPIKTRTTIQHTRKEGVASLLLSDHLSKILLKEC